MMSSLAAICRAIDFVEDNLQQSISVADMADAAAYSLYHFCRTFNSLVHHTPYDYLIRRRLSESARELVETDKKIIEIALDYQFNNPETYSRAFKRLLGVQPYHWRQHGELDGHFMMSRLTVAHIEHLNKGDYLRPVLKQRQALQLVGVMSLVSERCESVERLWDVLEQELVRLPGASARQERYGLCLYPQGWQGRGFLYLAAVESGALDTGHSVLVAKTIPAFRYACFTHKGTHQDLRLTLDYIYQTWLPRSNERPALWMELECFGHDVDSEWQICVPIAQGD